ncbi:hypothetical protein MP638_002367 [Amoeboaphelidium occidentale]|nr:hypothetical protein MP638_002367 [Amoeboaphelidium occidentale]
MKISQEKCDRDIALPEDYDAYFSFCTSKKGYSGVTTYVKKSCPLRPSKAFDKFEAALKDLDALDDIGDFSLDEIKVIDEEGRVVITEHPGFVLLNIYAPNESSDERRSFKVRFNALFELYIVALLRSGRQVVVVGDLNVCRSEMDHADPEKSNKDNGLSNFDDHPTRKWFNEFLQKRGLVDVYRIYFPDEKGAFTCWNTLLNGRPANYGTRIDYILVSSDLMDKMGDVKIEKDVMGSDHCPLSSGFKIEVTSDDRPYKAPKLNSKFWDKFSSKQKTIKSYFQPIKRPREEVKEKPDNKDEDDEVIIVESKEVSVPLTKSPKTGKLSADWAHIPFGVQKPPPLCKHNEPCKEMTVNKSGPNKGRRFYLCSRPVGPKDTTGKTQFRCDFFAWKFQKSTDKKDFKKD